MKKLLKVFSSKSFFNWIIIPIIVLMGVFGVIFSNQYIQNKRIVKVDIDINSFNGKYFINKRDIFKIITNNATEPLEDKYYKEIKTSYYEKLLEKNPFIANAEVSKDLGANIHITIHQRVPVARIFASNGLTYYLDSGAKKMPFSLNYSAKVPVFTMEMDSTISNKQFWIKNKSIARISKIIQSDEIISAFTGSINIDAENHFQIYPKIGDFKINLGDTSIAENKFRRLKLFILKGIPKEGWDKYEYLDLQFKGQLIASKIKKEGIK